MDLYCLYSSKHIYSTNSTARLFYSTCFSPSCPQPFFAGLHLSCDLLITRIFFHTIRDPKVQMYPPAYSLCISNLHMLISTYRHLSRHEYIAVCLFPPYVETSIRRISIVIVINEYTHIQLPSYTCI